MSIPHIAEMYQPILELLEDEKQPIFIHDFEEPICDYFLLSESERAELTLKSCRTRVFSRISNALSHLKNGGLVTNTRRGFYILTSKGLRYQQSGLKASFDNLMGLKEFNSYITEQEEKRRKRQEEKNNSQLVPAANKIAKSKSLQKQYIDAEAYINNDNYVKNAHMSIEIPKEMLMEKVQSDTRIRNLLMYSCVTYADSKLMITQNKMCYTSLDIKDSALAVNKGEAPCIGMSIDKAQGELFDVELTPTAGDLNGNSDSSSGNNPNSPNDDTSMRTERGRYKKSNGNIHIRD